MVAFVLAAKFNDDLRLSNADFAKIGGIGAAELFTLELEMLSALEFNLSVSKEVFVSYLRQILP